VNTDHFAIVIGLASYPNLGDPPPANLQSPENDADAVVAWLLDAKGGALPESNIWKIRSRDQDSPPKALPTRDKLEEAFLWLDKVAAANQSAGKGRKVGTRLYFYVSGHGFSPGFRAGCLLAGNAAERQFSANIFPSAWLDWLRDADYFSEYILWMDCCMDRQVLTPPTPPPLTPIGGGGAGRTFIAFAAPRPLKAAEKEIPPDGKQWHGVFTWNLLEGLRGAAANQFGLVTAASLADWIRQAQLGWLDSADRSNASVAKEPSIVEKDDSIVFAKGVAPLTFDITLGISDATTPTDIRLWSGSPPNPGPPITIAPGGTQIQLTPGLYLAEGAGLRQGFAVTRSMTIDLAERGEPVKQPGGKFTLQIDPADASADITVIQGRFNVLMGGKAQLVCPLLDFGLYQFRITIGRQIVEKIILLDRDWPPSGAAPGAVAPASDVLPPLPQITSAAPLPGTRATHEYQQEAARSSTNDVQAGAGAELMVMARWFSSGGQAPPGRMPWQDVVVLDASGKVVADLDTQGRHDPNGDPTGVCTLSLGPGAYELRYPVGSDTRFVQSLILPPGNWRAEAYVLYDARDRGSRASVSLLMRKQGASWGTDDDLQLQKALVALADERPIQNLLLSDLLAGKSFNPLAAIVSAHLLVLSAESPADGAKVDLDQLNKLITMLRDNVGSDHPDVEALSQRCPNPELRASKPVRVPPIFERSWELLLDASQDRPELIPSALWKKIHVRAGAPPYLVWCPDSEVQAAYIEELTKSVFHERLSPASATSPPSSAAKVTHAIQSGLEGLASRAVRGLGRIGMKIDARVPDRSGIPLPQQAPAPSSGVSDQEIVRRTRVLHLPPAALEVLRQQFRAATTAAQVEPERGAVSGGI
jgi:Caspase domain